jgi:hypothetical protein
MYEAALEQGHLAASTAAVPVLLSLSVSSRLAAVCFGCPAVRFHMAAACREPQQLLALQLLAGSFQLHPTSQPIA